MKGTYLRVLLLSVVLSGWLISSCAESAAEPLPPSKQSNIQTFAARGVIKELKADGKTAVLSHEAIANYMGPMTMPFKVKETNELAGLRAGDQISFRLFVTDTESWIGQIAKVGTATSLPSSNKGIDPRSLADHSLLDYKFTNELGESVCLRDFNGKALAITFFFTRCPIPDYCPRLSRNFQEASSRLSSLAGAPTNWHFLSISFDTDFDNPQVLKAYGEMYHYDPTHWSFLTGPADKIGELARLSDLKFKRDAGSFNHDFRTLIIDRAGHLQMVFPTGGKLSDAIVDEILRAAVVTNGSVVPATPARAGTQSPE
jgi:protein SCO1/2